VDVDVGVLGEERAGQVAERESAEVDRRGDLEPAPRRGLEIADELLGGRDVGDDPLTAREVRGADLGSATACASCAGSGARRAAPRVATPCG
jgi:hypothetical protein